MDLLNQVQTICHTHTQNRTKEKVEYAFLVHFGDEIFQIKYK